MDIPLLGHGYYYDQMAVGFRFRTMARTIIEPDLASFVNLAWFTEPVFVDLHDRGAHTLQGRVVPGMMVYVFAEGLVAPSLLYTGQAFLSTGFDVKLPTVVGDTIHVEVEVTESRPASRGNRGLVRTSNNIVNQRGEVVINYTPLRLVSGTPK